MCKDCRDVIKAEIEFLLRILYTPEVSVENIALVNETLGNALLDLYGYEEEDEQEGNITVTSLNDLFNKES